MAITKEEIITKCSEELIASRDCVQIASLVSAGRVRSNKREIGVGTILETIGMDAGNVFLDVIYNSPTFRYIKPLIDQGRLVVGSPLVQATIRSFVPSVLTQSQADALSGLGKEEDPCTAQEVALALYNADGSMK